MPQGFLCWCTIIISTALLQLKLCSVQYSWWMFLEKCILMGSLIIPYPTTPQVNDEYMKTLEILSKKIKFIEADSMVKTSKALKDVQPEVERLRQKAVSKVWKLFAGFLFLMFQTRMFIRTLVDRPVCVACVSSAYVLIWCKTLCLLYLMF